MVSYRGEKALLGAMLSIVYNPTLHGGLSPVFQVLRKLIHVDFSVSARTDLNLISRSEWWRKTKRAVEKNK